MPQSSKVRPQFPDSAQDSHARVPALPVSDPAFESLLSEIVQQCRFTTRATGAAIAMAAGDAMVCRATTGGHAPDLGIRLDTKAGLSGACVQSRKVQICEDTELDSRVDVVACRALGVRSILVVPLLRDNELLGVIELFSPVVRAFGERDVQTLDAYAQRIQDAQRKPKAEDTPIPKPEIPLDVPASLLPHDSAPEPPPEAVEAPRRDFVMPVLTGLVIALAIVLGALLGMHRSRGRSGLRAPISGGPASLATSTSPAVPVNANGAAPAGQASSKETGDPHHQAPATTDPAGGLTVFQDGRVIFRVPPAESGHRTPADTGSTTDSAIDLAPDAAAKLLVSRVEPVYPPQAIAAQIQGAVGVRVTVDRSGSVTRARVFSGPPELAQAAVDAVKQWRFHPYAPAGSPQAFRTVTTIDFKLR